MNIQTTAVLDMHNKYRNDHGAAALSWDSGLQESARRHARQVSAGACTTAACGCRSSELRPRERAASSERSHRSRPTLSIPAAAAAPPPPRLPTAQCVWDHSQSRDRGGAGENMYFCRGCDPASSPQRALYVWYREAADYDYSTGRSKSGDALVGHFTQLVWQGTQRVGCAAVVCPKLYNIKQDLKDVDFVVW
jgi:hypothetical protein